MRTLSMIPTRQGPPAAPMTPRSVRRRSPGPGCRNLGGPLGAFARPGGMPANSRPGALGAVAGRAAAANPHLEITPTEAQYTQLCRDLKKLRKLGAPSHTAAIVAAVHSAAAGRLGHGQHE